MLAANEAVAEHFAELGVAFLRRVHPAPDEAKLKAFADFARTLGYDLRKATDRFSLQRVLARSADKPERHAVHYALLRSLKQAVYSPYEEEHYALASRHYCHFTSPIRRYPDLTVHRQLDQWIRTGRVGGDVVELAGIGEHSSRMERRADAAERELVKLRLLDYMASRVGTQMDAVITGVAEYGFFAQAEQMPVEGRVHISTLSDDYYVLDEEAHTLTGRRTKKRYRLGDPLRVEVVRVDQVRRQIDFRVAESICRDAETSRRKARSAPQSLRVAANQYYFRASPQTAQAESVEIHVLALFVFAGAAAVEAHAQESPNAERLTLGVVTVGGRVAFQHPSPTAAISPHFRVFLPALEYAGHGLQSRTTGLRIVDMDAVFVRRIFPAGVRQAAHGLEELMLQGRGSPRGPKVKSHQRRLEDKAIELEAHRHLPPVSY